MTTHNPQSESDGSREAKKPFSPALRRAVGA
jgi:hypothetical protein